MNIDLGRLAAYVRLDFSRLKGDSERAKRELKSLSQAMTKQMAEAGKAMTLSLSAPLAALGKSIVSTTLDMEGLKRGMVSMTGSTKEAEAQMRRLKEASRLPGLEFESLVTGSIRLQSAGLSAKNAERALKAFGNELAKTPQGAKSLEGVSTAMSQILSKNKFQAEELQQLAERIPSIGKAMRATFGTFDTEIIQKAGITAQEAIEALTRYYERQSKVQSGSAEIFKNFHQTIQESLAEIGKTLMPDVTRATKELEAGVKRLIGWWKGLDDGTRLNIIRFAEFAAIAGPLALTVGALGSAVTGLSAAFAGLRTVLTALSSPMGGVVAGMAAIAGGIIYLQNRIESKNREMLNDIRKVGDAATARRVQTLSALPTADLRKQLDAQRQMAKADKTGMMEMMRRQQQGVAGLTAQQRRALAASGAMDYDLPTFSFKPQSSAFETKALEQALRRRMESERSQKAAKAEADSFLQEMQNKIKQTAQAGIDKKAEAAQKKAEAALERQRRAQIGHATALHDLLTMNEKSDQESLKAMLSEWTEKWTAGEDKRKKDVWANFFGSLRGAMDRVRLDQEDRNKEAMLKKAMSQTSGFLGGASGALKEAMGVPSKMAEHLASQMGVRRSEEARAAAEKMMASNDKVAAHLLRTNQTSLTEHRKYLQSRLDAVRGNVEEETRLRAEIAETDQRIEENKTRQMEDLWQKRYRSLQIFASNFAYVFQNAFADVLSGARDFFSSLLDGFKAMLIRMAAEWAASQVFNGLMELFGGKKKKKKESGGGLLGGLANGIIGGALSIFGFDNGANDSRAYRWGHDFSRHFANGALDQSRSAALQGRGRMAMAGAGSSVAPITVQINGPINIHNDMDAQRLGEQIAMSARNSLRRRVS